jgi:hypothetical protein
LVGLIAGTSSVSASHANGNITGGSELGGFAGQLGSGDASTITSSYATGSTNATGGNVDAGGFIGFINGLSSNPGISDSYATGNATAGSVAAGFIAYMNGGTATFQNCFAQGTVSSPGNPAGGFIGEVASGTFLFQNNYASGLVTGGGGMTGGSGDNSGHPFAPATSG